MSPDLSTRPPENDHALPLAGLIVLDFSQFLAGPSCALRLADLGARVIKIERPDGGDACRALFLADLGFDQDSALFHAINRGKESYTADLKNAGANVVDKEVATDGALITSRKPDDIPAFSDAVIAALQDERIDELA